MRKTFSISFVFASVLLSVFAIAQTPGPVPQQPAPQKIEPADDDTVVRITTNLIQVDAVVTDKKGNPVTNLSPEDFEILVNGKPQKITNFSLVTTESPSVARPAAVTKTKDKNAPPVPPVPTAPLHPGETKRAIALVVDDLTLGFCNVVYVKKALKKFVDVQMQPGDLVAIVRVGSSLGALQQFTSNKQQLYAAIESIKYNFSAGRIINSDVLEGLQEDVRANASLAAVNYVVKGMRGLPGRKAVLFLSEGFQLFDDNDPSASTRVRETVERIVDSSNRAGVVVYTMDARGVVPIGLEAASDLCSNFSAMGSPSSSAMSSASPRMTDLIPKTMSGPQIQAALGNRSKLLLNTQDGLRYLAEKSGGFAVYNTNDLGGGIKKVLDDQNSYYLIGFQPDSSILDSNKSRFNHLTIKVKGQGLKVRYRSGFFGLKDDEVRAIASTPQQQIMKSLTSPFTSDAISLRLTPVFGHDTKAGSFVRSLVHISAKDLTFTDKPDRLHEAVVNVVAYMFGDNGIVVNSVGETHTITLTDSLYQRALTSGLVYSLTVAVKRAGAYQLRVAVRDDRSSKVGSASQFITIPDIQKGRLALSGIALSSSSLQPASTTRSDSAGETSSALTQAALRRFRAGHILQFAYAIHNATIEKLTGQPQLTTQVKLYRDGKEIFAGKETPYDAKEQIDLQRVIVEGSLQLGGLEEGDFVLQIIVRDLLGKEKYRIASGWVDFEIVNENK